jgi:peptidoglycan/LPS O-acetylase OafA/YrhL
MKSERVHLNGLDWIRALMSVGIVTWHLRTFGASQLYTEKIASYKINLGDVANFGIIILGVPIFITMSCYLVARFPPDWPKMRHRLWRLVLLLAFWTSALSVWKGGYEQLRRLIPRTPLEAAVKILSANGEYYYFFVSLIICLVLTYLFMRLSTRWNAVAFAAAVLAVFALPQIAISFKVPGLVNYWTPLNFIPYPFLAILLTRAQGWALENGKRLAWAAAGLIGAAGLFAWYEWTHYVNLVFFFSDDLSFPLHMRNSLTFAIAAVMLVALWPWKTAPAVIRFMSKHSLALYVLHAFFKPIVLQNLTFAFLPGELLARLAQITVVVLLCYLTSLALPAFLKEELIR